MRKVLFVALIVVGLVFTASLGALLALRRAPARDAAPTHDPARSDDPLHPDPPATALTIPPFTATDSTGATITESVFEGRLTVVDFVFTHCPFICPMLATSMADLQARFKNAAPTLRARVQLLSLSVDPAHDTPERLARYAASVGADPNHWTFATLRESDVAPVVERGLKFAVGADPKTTIDLPSGATMHNIIHPPWFVLVGPTGNVLGIYNPGVPGELDALAARIEAAHAKLVLTD